ncbi:MAG TPA: sulfurtransferase TusA family protein [Phycisphaerae bacterium]|jgi:TusA-related sulfurtransferase|nr:sulfurtransferase TusA family protein [Phycisphaerae bacterium]HPM25027.1 sulfurtransferase TusA family protein [Phycisphaerae bacterium]HQL54270.1 sulfurtransferase TusA family protein [Phycisphaerae bacterium]
MAEKVDARGLSCPQPVMLTRQALQKAAGGPVVVLLDSMTQVQNCTRAAESLGWQVNCEQKGREFELTLRK